MRVFYQENCKTGAEATIKSGIGDLTPTTKIDAYQFEPCGQVSSPLRQKIIF